MGVVVPAESVIAERQHRNECDRGQDRGRCKVHQTPGFFHRRAVMGEGRNYLRLVEHLGHVLPVDQMIDKGLEVIRPAIAVIDVIGMLPNVTAEDRLRALHQRALAVRRFHDGDLAVLDREPAPARAELADARRREIFLHFRDRAEVRDDFLFQRAGNLVAAARGLHPFPEMDVVEMLAGIVEEGGILAVRALDHLLERFAFPLGALEQVVAVIHVSEVMLVVMKFEGLARHVGREGVIGIGKVGKRKGHGRSPGTDRFSKRISLRSEVLFHEWGTGAPPGVNRCLVPHTAQSAN